MQRGNFEGGKGTHCKLYGLSAVRSATTAELIETPLGMWTRVGPRKHVLDGGARWRRLANTTEPSVNGGDATLYPSGYPTLDPYAEAFL